MADERELNQGEGTRADVSGGTEGDWSYLRAHLDNPRLALARRLGSGLAAWILSNWHSTAARPARLNVLARIPLGPRQSVALIEAEGVHLLVGTSADGAPSFFSLHPEVPSTASERGSGPLRDEGLAAAVWQPPSHGRPGAPGWVTRGQAGRRLGLPGRVSW